MSNLNFLQIKKIFSSNKKGNIIYLSYFWKKRIKITPYKMELVFEICWFCIEINASRMAPVLDEELLV